MTILISPMQCFDFQFFYIQFWLVWIVKLLCSSVLFNWVMFTTVLFTTVLFNTVQLTTVLFNKILLTKVWFTRILLTTFLFTTYVSPIVLLSPVLFSTVLFRPGVDDTSVSLFSVDLCRSLVLEKFGEGEVGGLLTQRWGEVGASFGHTNCYCSNISIIWSTYIYLIFRFCCICLYVFFKSCIRETLIL